MEKPTLPANENERLNALLSYDILDTVADKNFDDIVILASKICGTPISHISLIDSNRQWLLSQVGLKNNEVPRDNAFCSYAILHQEEFMVVQDATKDYRFHDNPLVTGDPMIRFYAGMPIVTPDGFPLGTLCVIDNKPRFLNEDQIQALKTLASQVINQLELKKKVGRLQEAYQIIQNHQEQLTRVIVARDKLLSIIAHDMRGPISNLLATISMFEQGDLSLEESLELIRMTGNHVKSSNNLLDSLMQWAKVQMDGQDVQLKKISPYLLVIEAVETILISSESKNNKIDIQIPNSLIINSDPDMLSFIFRNLIGNANKFTSKGSIKIDYSEDASNHIFSVADTGRGIEEKKLASLFEWDTMKTTKGTSGEKGTGLGLAICKELVEKQFGHLAVSSKLNEGTTISFSIPKNL